MHREAISVPAFGGIEVSHITFAPLDARQRAALDRFLALDTRAKAGATRHVYSYYRDIRDADGADEVDPSVPPPQQPDGIWAHVRLGTLMVDPDPEGQCDGYVSLSGKCGWEVEHGLAMVWRNGTDLVKVGQRDGHVTNARAYADPTLEPVVYKALNPVWTTLRDG